MTRMKWAAAHGVVKKLKSVSVVLKPRHGRIAVGECGDGRKDIHVNIVIGIKCNDVKSRICEWHNGMTRKMQRCSNGCHKLHSITTRKHIQNLYTAAHTLWHSHDRRSVALRIEYNAFFVLVGVPSEMSNDDVLEFQSY